MKYVALRKEQFILDLPMMREKHSENFMLKQEERAGNITIQLLFLQEQLKDCTA